MDGVSDAEDEDRVRERVQRSAGEKLRQPDTATKGPALSHSPLPVDPLAFLWA